MFKCCFNYWNYNYIYILNPKKQLIRRRLWWKYNSRRKKETVFAYKYDWQCSTKFSKEQEKASFLDENIVFVLEGYGNVYYSHDFVNKLTAGEEFTYWAYNKEAAISQGYKKEKC